MRPAAVRARLEALEQPRVLVVRNDGLGDFVLTLPLVAALKRHLPGAHVTVLVSAALAGLVPLLADVDAVIADPGVVLKRHRHRMPSAERAARVAELAAAVRAGRFDAALLPYAESGTARLVHRAGIPVRAGPLRRHFFWRFNAHDRRGRRRSGQAEYALNLGLLAALGLPQDYVAPRVTLPDESPSSAFAAGALGDYAVLHPHKRSGTALTWPMEHFVAIAAALRERGLAVVVIGDGPDRPVLEGAFQQADLHIETDLSLPDLLELLARARLFVGNSSGPLHLAGLVGTPHVALYPQDLVSAPERWRTLPAPSAPKDFRSYLLASSFPKGCVTCEGERCAYFNCVASLPPEAVWQALDAWGLDLHEH